VIDDARFWAIASPSFAPDGSAIAFAAVGEPEPGPGLGHFLIEPPRRRAPPQHGPPWDVWLVRPDGSGLRRLTRLAEDECTLAWSPDGRWLALNGGLALWLVRVDGSQPPWPLGEAGYGRIDWAIRSTAPRPWSESAVSGILLLSAVAE
jgi:Tol biopolymer transport system component